jgi:heptosyltransferase-2
MRRILLTRTDRIGDVVLSTPALKAIRDAYPDAYIAFMVRPYAKDIVEGNPYLDEVILYDKYGAHKSAVRTVMFALRLRKKRFDTAFMLHPTNRVHAIAFMAGIPARIGYRRKLGILLTRAIPHRKQEGAKHESDYAFDLLRTAGIEPGDRELFVPVHEQDMKSVERMLDEHHVGEHVMLVAVNPGASCPSKRWPSRYFAAVSDELAATAKARIVIVADAENRERARDVARTMKYEPVDLSGKTTVGELAALLTKCRLFISNDSGPVHIACAVGTPVISIFGRKDPGLSPKRWAPLSRQSRVFHEDVGCGTCLAHDCRIGFKCLEAVSPSAVSEAARTLLASS